MSANIITPLVPVIYRALDTIPRELVGAIPAVRRWPSTVRVAKNQPITFPVVPTMSVTDVAAAATAGPDPSGITIGSDTLSMTNSKWVNFPWSGEEAAGLDSSGLFAPILQDQFSQAFREIGNLIEADLCALATASSRAYGDVSKVPFSTANDLSDLNFTKKILKDNGSPQGDLHFILSTNDHATLQSIQTTVYKANEYGNREGLEMGTLSKLQNVNIHESGQIQTHTAGTGTGQTVTGGAYGDTTIVVSGGSTGSGILPGDVVTIGGNKYVVATAMATVSGITSFGIYAPGIVTPAGVVGQTVTNIGNYEADWMIDRNAVVLISALPNMPPMGDIAADTKVVVDPVTGLQFEIAIYKQTMQATWSVRAAWGVKMVKPAFSALLLSKPQ